MSQSRLGVPVDVARELANGFQNRKDNFRTCHSCGFTKAQLIQNQVNALPEIEPGFLDYHAVSRIVSANECYKMGGFCNRWPSWMRARLNDTKEKLP